MIAATIHRSHQQLDTIVARLARRLTARQSVRRAARRHDESGPFRRFDRIRRTFAAHTPPILVGRHVGTGGFADVFLAESDYEGESDFALKVLRTDQLRIRSAPGVSRTEEEMRVKDVKRRFANEASIQWHLSKSLSPRVARCVVRVYDHGEFDSERTFRFILMERMGSTLRDFVADPANHGSTPELLLYKTALMITIADIIRTVHREGVFHRDIKPENILFPLVPGDDVTPGGHRTLCPHVKLADFGAVRWVRSSTDPFDDTIIGSQLYMSPEQILQPQQLDPRTDIYSFGLVCYELLYGVHAKPFDRHHPVAVDVLARTPPRHRTPPAGFAPLDDIIMTCLADLDTRYQTMDQVTDELHAFATGRGM
jgi:serine/threonine protein kinase